MIIFPGSVIDWGHDQVDVKGRPFAIAPCDPVTAVPGTPIFCKAKGAQNIEIAIRAMYESWTAVEIEAHVSH
jgi:hypothetical protein